MECGVFLAVLLSFGAMVVAAIALSRMNAIRAELEGLREALRHEQADRVRQAQHAEAPPPPPPLAMTEQPITAAVDDAIPPPPIRVAAPQPPTVSGWYVDSATAPDATPPPPPFTAASPPPPPPPPVTPAPARGIDWENLVGIRLFSWIAGIALVLAAVFLFKYSVEHGWLRPSIRAAFGLLSGIALLIVCETKVARGYRFTANAMLGAGIAILYATLFAMHARWSLVEPWIAFLGMLLVTAAAVFLSTRRDSVFVALLGLLGGFATPALLSSGENRPVALFSYLLLLNGGLSWVAYRKRWPALTALSVLLTVIYQWSWIAKFLDTGQLPLAAAVFVLFAVVGASALWVREGDSAFERTATFGAAVPLLFAFFTAIVPEYGARYTVLFGFLLLMTAGLAAIAIWRGPAWLHTLGAGATVVTWFIWLTVSYTRAAWPAALGWLAAFILLYLLAGLRIRSAAMYAAPILFFALILLSVEEPQSYVLLMTVALALLVVVAAFAVRFNNVAMLNIALVLTGVLVGVMVDAPGAMRLAVALAVASIAIVTMMARTTFWQAAVTALYVAQVIVIVTAQADVVPAFAAVVATLAVLVVATLTVATLANAFATALPSLFLCVVAIASLERTPTQQLIFATALYALYVAWPVVVRARVGRSLIPHLAASLSGIVFFIFFWDGLVDLGYRDVIGLLPLVLALVTVALLWDMLRLPEQVASRTAIVAGTALAFITAAVPLQFEREWITIAWALLAAALGWLYTRVPHRGLIIWSAGLLAAVFVRLVFNPAVFDYHPRSDTPLFNWYLYTYAICAAAAFVAGYFLPAIRRFTSAGAVILLFVLLNIEIADFYSKGEALTFNFFSSSLAQDLTYTMGWALFAIAMLIAGIALASRGARVAALGLLLVTVLKCFLHDLGRLGGLYRVGSLFGLAASLVLVGILLQKFVMRRRPEEAMP